MYQRAENGKTELSLMHFAISNPRWQPPPHSGLFLNHVKERLQRDAAPHGPAEGALRASLLGDGSAAVRACGAVRCHGDIGGGGDTGGSSPPRAPAISPGNF